MLSRGLRLGPYEVIEPLGAGGMGEVYVATDTRLGRKVALKILPPEFAQNPERRARFEREARSIARLEHPHICALHDVGDGFLVMELLEGETLAKRLGRGPLPLPEVVRYGGEIAEALERAHRAGVVHRDLKPSNVMLTKSGAKLLDFGVAKMNGMVEVSPDSLTREPSLTADGKIVGSFPYMAPEQVEGRAVDHRTDIFALGAILFEMATGRRAFEGGTGAAVIGAILQTRPPRPSSLVAAIPAGMDRVVAKCLEKDADERWQSAKDVAIELAWVSENAAPPRHRAWAWSTAILGGTSVLLAIALGVNILRSREIAPAGPHATAPALAMRKPTDFVIRPIEGWAFASPFVRPFSVSPDGSNIVFTVMQAPRPTALVLQSLEEPRTVVVENTDSAFWPFWSEDGRHVAFFQNGSLKKMNVEGGGAVTICSTGGAGRGAAWSRWGTIVFATKEGLYVVPADGGEAERILTTSDGTIYSDPDFLPDGTHFLLTTYDRDRRASIVVRRLGDDFQKTLIRDATNGRWLDSGHLLFVRGETLLAQRLDPTRIELSGEPAVVLERVGVERRESMGALYGASRKGEILAFQPSSALDVQLKLFDRQGNVLKELAGPARIAEPRLSHDGTRVAVMIDEPTGNADIWVIDLRTGLKTRLTTEPTNDAYPVWSPDDAFIAFSADLNLYRIPATGGPPELLLKSERQVHPTSWSPDGRTILLTEGGRPGMYDIVAFRLADRSIAPVVASTFAERAAQFSPDGQWILFLSDLAGSMHVYVQRWSDGSRRTRITPEGAPRAFWSGDGNRIYARNRVYEVSRGEELIVKRVDPLFERPPAFPRVLTYAVLSDETVIGGTHDEESQRGEIQVRAEWLRRLP